MRGRWIVPLMLALGAGCGEGRTRTPTAEVPPASEAAAAATLSEAELAALLQELTQVVRRYGVEQQKVPAHLEELVNAGYLARLPEAPPGKRFAIGKRLEVTLEDFP